MVTLPRYNQPQVAVSNQRQVQRFNRVSASDPVGEATQQAGDALGAFADKIHQGKVAAEMAKSDIQLRDELDKTYRELEADTDSDPATFEERFKERTAEIVAGKSANIPGGKAQGVWQERANELVFQRTQQVRDLTRTRQVDNVRAESITVGAEYKRLSEDPATSDETLAASREMYLQLIEVNRKGGIYDNDTAAALKQEADETHRASVSMRHLTNVDSMMDAGRYGEAEAYFKASDHEILPDKREGVEDALMLKSRAAKAIETADSYWSESGGDFMSAIEKARAIKDVDERLAVEDRLTTMRVQDGQAKAEAENSAMDSAWSFLSEGGSSVTMDAATWKALPGRERVQIQNWERSRREAAKRDAQMSALERQVMKTNSGISRQALEADRATDPELYMGGPAVWAEEAPDLFEDWQAMLPEDQMKVRLDIQERKAKGESVSTVDAAFKDVIDLVEFNLHDNAPEKADYNNETSKKPFTTHERELRGTIRTMVAEYTKRTGTKEVPPDVAKQIIAKAYRAIDPEEYPIRTNVLSGEFVGNMQLMSKATTIARQRLGRDPTEGEVRVVYDQLAGE